MDNTLLKYLIIAIAFVISLPASAQNLPAAPTDLEMANARAIAAETQAQYLLLLLRREKAEEAAKADPPKPPPDAPK